MNIVSRKGSKDAPPEMRKLRMLSLCAGIGGADLAAEWTGGIEIVGQVEVDSFCQAVLAKHWPDVLRMSDINEVRGDEFGPVDLVVGGIPCQPFSSAGRRRGKADDRHLWPQAFAIIKTARPAWVVIENVDDFASMVLDDVSADLEGADYSVQAYVLPACAVGAPHVRERCFVVAYSASCRLEKLTRAGRSHNESEPSDPESVADANGQRQPECGPTAITGGQGRNGRCVDAYRLSRATQSRLGRIAHGFAAWLDGYRWPVGPGQEQEAWEPPRTIATRTHNHSRRLKALGNGMVWQQIYPILQNIVDLEAER